MLPNRLHHLRTITLILALLAVAILLSALSPQVRADSLHLIADISGAPLRGNASANQSMSLLQDVPTMTPTASGPFTCSKLLLSNKRLFGNQFRIDIQNDNDQPTYITRIKITWPNIPAFAQTGLAQMSLNTVTIWNGPDPQNLSSASTTTDTDTKPGSPPFSSTPQSDRILGVRSANVYAASFNGPPLLANYVSTNQYALLFTIDNPLIPTSPCVLASSGAPPTATPIFGGQPSPSPTSTPDCASGLITIKFTTFDNFGMVRFDILSQRTTPSTLVGFNINWQKYVNSQRLRQVSMIAPPGQTGSVVVWQAGAVGENITEDANPPTKSHTEGIWLTNFTVPPGALGSPSLTSIFFDFDGIYRYDDYYNSTNPPYGGASDFNFSYFELTCNSTGGGQPIKQVTPEVIPSPTPIFTPTLTATSTSAPATPPMINFYTTHTPTLTWNRVTWATGYEIQISTDKNFAPALTTTKILPDQPLTYTTERLANGTYYWRVMALGGSPNLTKWSAVDTFVISAVDSP
jgi:hypothetical protein